ncbi:MAG: glycosyltransferase family 2 protein [Nanoarchaeota archaeon]
MTNKNPLVSVVMPVYNSEKYLAEAIESVLNQSFKNFEFIIVDDDSADTSVEIIKKYAQRDKRIKILYNKKNFGIAKTRNRGILEAKGKYIATHDSDDISTLNRFQMQVKYLEEHCNVGVVGNYIEIFSENHDNTSVRKYPENDKDLRRMIFFACPIAQPTSMIRKEVFEKVGLYNKKYPPAEDLDLWFRIGTKYELANIPKVLLKYRESLFSATAAKTRLMEKLSLKIRFKNCKNPMYNFNSKAFLYNSLHLLSLFIIPSKLKILLFQKIRDKKNV